jgi:glycerol-3-phosphate dehydrogenase
MKKTVSTIACVGMTGSFGFTIANVVARVVAAFSEKLVIRLHIRQPDVKGSLKIDRTLEVDGPLAGLPLPGSVLLCDSLRDTLDDADVCLFGTPSRYAISVLRKMEKAQAPRDCRYLLLTKGLIFDNSRGSFELMTEAVRRILRIDRDFVATLIGPNIFSGIAESLKRSGEERPVTSALLSSSSADTAAELERLLSLKRVLNIHLGSDTVAPQVCAGLKNVIALGMGFADEWFGDANYSGSLFAAALNDVHELIRMLDGDASVASGPAGVGDLFTTTMKGRSAEAGRLLARGSTKENIIDAMRPCELEAFHAIAVLREWIARKCLTLPVIRGIGKLVDREGNPTDVLNELVAPRRRHRLRDPHPESRR